MKKRRQSTCVFPFCLLSVFLLSPLTLKRNITHCNERNKQFNCVTYCRQFILNIFNIFIKTITILITIVKTLPSKKKKPKTQVLRVALNGSSVCNSENVFTLSACFSLYCLEAFTMDNGGARFVIFLLGNPHLLEGGQRGQD